MYVEIFRLRDGKYEQVLRAWEDGRLEGQPMWMQEVARCRRPDPITGTVAMRGPALIRRLAACNDTGYTMSRVSVADVACLPPTMRRRRPRG